ncbi:MAG: diguanylate cyclase domain-containing protein [Burkholderiales bacterium]
MRTVRLACVRNRFGHAWRVILGGLFLLAAAITHAQDPGPLLLSESGGTHSLKGALWYLADPGKTLGIDDVMRGSAKASFLPHPSGNPNFGSSAAAYWFRFAVRAPHASVHRWFLEIDFPPLDQTDLYSLGKKGEIQIQRSGDTLAFHERPIKVPNHVFELSVAPGETREFFLRVTSSGSITVPLALYDEHELREQQNKALLWAGIFFGCLVSLGIYNLLVYFSIRDRSYLYYTFATVAFVMVYVATFGYGFQYLWPDSVVWNNRAPVTLALLALAATVPFTRNFLHTAFNAPRLDKLLTSSALIAISVAFLNLGVVSYAHAFRALSALLVLHVLLLLIVCVVCMRRGDPLARFFLLAWTPMILASLAYVMRSLTWLPPHFLTVYGFQVGSALEMILLSFALGYRITQARREKEIAQEALLHTLRESERVLEERVEERTGELHAANLELASEVAERRKAQERLTQLAHHDPLTGLPNRALLKERFSQAASQAKRNQKTLGVLLLDLDQFKQVNDTLGHDVGDALLVSIGQVLREVVRETDTVARLGGDEFVLLVSDVADRASLSGVADKILARLAEPIATGDEDSLRAGGSIGIAEYPGDGTDLETLLRLSDAAMYRAKGDGRMCYRYASQPAAQDAMHLPGGGLTRDLPRTSEP